MARCQDDCYKALFVSHDSCVTLSCSSEGLVCLLGSVFFETSMPCNLIGAHILGVSRAIESMQSDERIFAALMAGRKPRLSALWQAATWSGRSEIFSSPPKEDRPL